MRQALGFHSNHRYVVFTAIGFECADTCKTSHDQQLEHWKAFNISTFTINRQTPLLLATNRLAELFHHKTFSNLAIQLPTSPQYPKAPEQAHVLLKPQRVNPPSP